MTLSELKERATVYPDEASWLAARRELVTASEAAIVLNQVPSAWGSAYSLALQKLGLIGWDDIDPERAEWGHRNEPNIASWYADKTGHAVVDLGDYAIVRHPDYPWLGATLDRVAMTDSGLIAVELKSRANDFDWNHGTPLYVQVQTQIQMLCSGLDRVDVAVLFGGTRAAIFSEKRHPRFCDTIIPKLREFYDLIQRGELPPIDGGEATGNALRRMHPDDSGETVTVPYELDALETERARLNEEIDERKVRVSTIDNTIKAAIGDATFGETSKFRWSWKTQESPPYCRVSIDDKAALDAAGIKHETAGGTKSRVLRRSKV